MIGSESQLCNTKLKVHTKGSNEILFVFGHLDSMELVVQPT